ncbi:hypothetical protein LINGRAHAP2_LOCUS17904 [Linum grandiflorum]
MAPMMMTTQARKNPLRMKTHLPRKRDHHRLPRHHMKISESGKTTSTPEHYLGNNRSMPGWTLKTV